MLESAQTGDVFIFDGHGHFCEISDENQTIRTKHACIRMRGSAPGIKGEDLVAVMKKSKAILYLNCCYAAFVAELQYDGQDKETRLRNAFAHVLSIDLISILPVRETVDEYMSLIKNPPDIPPHTEIFITNQALAIAKIGLDRSVYNIIPLSIGRLPSDPKSDIIVRALKQKQRVSSKRKRVDACEENAQPIHSTLASPVANVE